MRSWRCFVLPRHAAGDTFGFVGNGSRSKPRQFSSGVRTTFFFAAGLSEGPDQERANLLWFKKLRY
jgi:hypothetical protein